MKLTRTEEVAILIVSVLAAQDDRRVPLSGISAEHGVSLLFLKKITSQLKKAGIVRSKEGAGGGYTLAKDAQEISVLEILRSVHGTDTEIISSHAPRICLLRPCCVPQTIRIMISEALRQYLSHVTIDQIVKRKKSTL